LSILGILLAAISVVIYFNVGQWFAIAAEFVSDAGILVLLVGFCFAVSMPLQLYTAVLSGLQRYDVSNIALLVAIVLRTVLLVVLLVRGYGLLTMGIAFGFSEIVIRILHCIFVRILLSEATFSFSRIDFGLLRKMLAYGINTFLYAAGAIIILRASLIIIGIFVGTSEISQFTIAAAGILLLSQLLQTFTAAIKPAISDLDARNDQLHVKELAYLSQKYSLLLMIPSGCFLLVMGKEFLSLWVGAKFQDPTVINSMSIILAILTVGHCFRLSQYSNFLVLVGRGEHKVFGVFMALTALLCVVGSIISVKVFDWGLIGIAWSNFVPIVVISGLILPIYFNRKMNMSIKDNIAHVFWPVLLGSLPSVVFISVWKYVSRPDSWIEIFSIVISVMFITLISSWFLSLKPVERKRFVSIFARKKQSQNVYCS
jgi:O-antigen/teichoic acid export membrane protein